MGCCGSDPPQPPDPATQERESQLASLRSLPTQRLVDVAARTGGKVTVNGHVYDFSGMGDADVAKQYADAMAAAQLSDRQEFSGPQIEERLKELQLSNPEGVAMRQQYYNQILDDLNTSPDRPNAEALQKSILDDLNKGSTLDPQVARELHNTVLNKQIGQGNYSGNAAGSEEARATVKAGEDQLAQRQQRALAFLSSGTSPEDVQYRREQQGLSNLGSFLTGETPEAQFGQLSGAQNGAVPFYNYTPAGANPNASAQGQQYGQNIYNGRFNFANGQVNPWLAGLSGGIRGAGIGGYFGNQNPFGNVSWTQDSSGYSGATGFNNESNWYDTFDNSGVDFSGDASALA